MNNRQAALLAAASLYPDAYKAWKFSNVTSADVLTVVYQRADEIKKYLDEADKRDAMPAAQVSVQDPELI